MSKADWLNGGQHEPDWQIQEKGGMRMIMLWSDFLLVLSTLATITTAVSTTLLAYYTYKLLAKKSKK